MEYLGLMHESERYGYLLISGVVPTWKELAGEVNASRPQIEHLTAELLAKGVASQTKDGALYCRRMVRDAARRADDAERQRQRRGKIECDKGRDIERDIGCDIGRDRSSDIGRDEGAYARARQRLEARGQRSEIRGNPPLPPCDSTDPVDCSDPADAYEHWRGRVLAVLAATVPLTPRATEAQAAIDLCGRYPLRGRLYALVERYLASTHKPIRGQPPTLGQVAKWASWLESQDAQPASVAAVIESLTAERGIA